MWITVRFREKLVLKYCELCARWCFTITSHWMTHCIDCGEKLWMNETNTQTQDISFASIKCVLIIWICARERDTVIQLHSTVLECTVYETETETPPKITHQTWIQTDNYRVFAFFSILVVFFSLNFQSSFFSLNFSSLFFISKCFQLAFMRLQVPLKSLPSMSQRYESKNYFSRNYLKLCAIILFLCVSNFFFFKCFYRIVMRPRSSSHDNNLSKAARARVQRHDRHNCEPTIDIRQSSMKMEFFRLFNVFLFKFRPMTICWMDILFHDFSGKFNFLHFIERAKVWYISLRIEIERIKKENWIKLKENERERNRIESKRPRKKRRKVSSKSKRTRENVQTAEKNKII